MAAVPFRPLCVRTARGGERRCGARPGRCGRSERARALGPVSAGGSAAISDLGWHTVSGVELVNLAGRPQGITYLPPETPLGECAPDRPHLRPLHASARPDPPIRLCAQVRQNCYTFSRRRPVMPRAAFWAGVTSFASPGVGAYNGGRHCYQPVFIAFLICFYKRSRASQCQSDSDLMGKHCGFPTQPRFVTNWYSCHELGGDG